MISSELSEEEEERVLPVPLTAPPVTGAPLPPLVPPPLPPAHVSDVATVLQWFVAHTKTFW
jgi:hypothetical protein